MRRRKATRPVYIREGGEKPVSTEKRNESVCRSWGTRSAKASETGRENLQGYPQKEKWTIERNKELGRLLKPGDIVDKSVQIRRPEQV